jgi:hypothetical protein
MDLPGTVLPGIAWQAYVSGLPYADYYIVAKTFIDSSASRGGMVFSHALFLPLDEATRLDDLSKVIRLLQREANRAALLTPINLSTFSPSEGGTVQPPSGPGLAWLAEALVSARRWPVVWLGQTGFTDSITLLWKHFAPDVRSSFSFRLSFGPNDCHDEPPTAVCTPDTAESSWAGYAIVRPTQDAPKLSRAAHFLLGTGEGEALRQFRDSIQARVQRLFELTLLDKCQSYCETLDANEDEKIESLRLLAHFSPRAEAGGSIKRAAIHRVVARMSDMSPAHIGSMRNLDLRAFPNGRDLWDAVGSWVAQTARHPKTTNGEFAKVLMLAKENITPWANAVWNGFDAAAQDVTEHFGEVLWRSWQEDASTVPLTLPRLAREPQVEAFLAETCPRSLRPDTADAVANVALQRGWYRLHGIAMGAAYELAVALDRQLAVDRDQESLAGIEAVLSRSSPEETLVTALRRDDPRLVGQAGRRCAATPTLLNGFDPLNPRWQRILVAALDVNLGALDGLVNPIAAMHQLLDSLLAGEHVELNLVERLAQTRLGDLSGYPQRARVWRMLPAEATARLFPATADGWLARFESDPDFDPNVEDDLKQAIIQEPRLSRFLDRLIPTQLTIAARFFLRFGDLSEGQYRTWLGAVISRRARIPDTDAEMLGRVAAVRGWRNAAAYIGDERRKYDRVDLNPALQECYQLLSLWDRLRLRLSGVLDAPRPNIDEIWELLTQLAIELYPKGPTEGEVWHRAGGKDSNLQQGVTGESSWRQAIWLLRQGGGGKVSPRKLLSAMREDYAANEKLRLLSEASEFRDHPTN